MWLMSCRRGDLFEQRTNRLSVERSTRGLGSEFVMVEIAQHHFSLSVSPILTLCVNDAQMPLSFFDFFKSWKFLTFLEKVLEISMEIECAVLGTTIILPSRLFHFLWPSFCRVRTSAPLYLLAG